MVMTFRQQMAKKEKTIEEHSNDLLKQLQLLKEYGYVSDEHVLQLVEKACMHHDDGKANPEFQKRVTSEKKKAFNSEKEIPHNVLSTLLLSLDEFESKEDYYCVAAAIVRHHDFVDPFLLLQDKQKLQLAKDLLEGQNVYSLKRSDIKGMAKALRESNQAIKVKGLLNKCDYSASGGYQAEFPSDFLVDSMENVKKKWPTTSNWNDMQKYCMNHREDNLILIAQTGMGKTEAGLQWIGNNKGYFVLPIRTAINAIYNRVCDDILEGKERDTRVALLHSSSMDYYCENIEDVQLDKWEYEQRGKNLSMPLSISTMDQLFDFVFLYPGYEFKLATFSYSKFVIDEIQMYDPSLLAYLIFGLKRITEMGGKVCIMTATLAPFLQDAITAQIDIQPDNIKTFSNDLLRHNVKVINEMLNPEDIIAFYNKNKQKNSDEQQGKILVVCNTIKNAQAIFEALSESVLPDELHLLHSRFTRNDRSEKENSILEFGETYNQENEIDQRSGIWVSTSLVEASLDIDFDVLFTELQELNSLFQRFGRCNRKGIKPVDTPNCFVYTEIDTSLLKDGKHGFIDPDIYNVSKEALQQVDGSITEKEKINLINQAMTTEKLKRSQYMMQYNQTMKDLKSLKPYDLEKEQVKIRDIDTRDIIPHSVYEENYDEIHNSEAIILSENATHEERVNAKNTILGFAVGIYNYEWQIYMTACNNNKAEKYRPIMLGRKAKIEVMECNYSKEFGFSRMNYDEEIRDAIIF